MIVGDEYVYVAPPKTGTRSMYKWLIEHHGGKRLSETEDHQRVVPDEHRDKFVFATIRNPYARALSIYWSMYAPRSYSRQSTLRNQAGGATMRHFFQWAIDNPRKVGVGAMPVHTFLERCEPMMLLRTEVIGKDVACLPLPLVDPDYFFPFKNEIAHATPDVRDRMTPTLRKVIQKWAGSDFELGGYEL